MVKKWAYYNEHDPKKAASLRELIKDGFLMDGVVDERSIVDVRPEDLKGFIRCGFFAGIGLWDYALQLAGWPEDREVWHGSAPCQSFSTAGRQKGKADPRHLWPVWERLIAECRPASVFGEQVSAAIAHGWLDDVYQGLEAQGYAVGSAVLPACGVGAPHRRDRLGFVADATGERSGGTERSGREAAGGSQRDYGLQFGGAINTGDVADRSGAGLPDGGTTSVLRSKPEQEFERRCNTGDVANATGEQIDGTYEGGFQPEFDEASTLGDNESDGRQQRRSESGWREPAATGSTMGHHHAGSQGRGILPECSGELSSWTTGVEWINCADGKARLVKSGIRLLADGYPARVHLLHAAGDAIVPQLWAEFIKAFLEAETDMRFI